MSDGEALARDDEGDDDLLAVAAMIARVAALGEFVFLGEAFEVATGKIVQNKIVFKLEEVAEALLQIVLDGDLGFEQTIERAIEPILGDGLIGHAEQIVERGRSVPMLGQGEFAARLTQAIDDLDGDDVGGANRFLALRDVAFDDGIEAEVLPKPTREPNVAEASGVGPADFAETDAHDVGIIGQGNILIIREKT